MARYDREQPIVNILLALAATLFVCVGGGLLVLGLWVKSVPTAALGLAFAFAAVGVRPA